MTSLHSFKLGALKMLDVKMTDQEWSPIQFLILALY